MNTGNMYDQKETGYFSHIRREIADAVPKGIGRLLDVGCGEGLTALYLKEQGRCTWVGGIEVAAGPAKIAESRLDTVVVGNLETIELPFEEGSIDTILCLDVLEHLVDPWLAVGRLSRLLRPGGTIIASVPNVRSLKVLLPLIFRDQFKYCDAGILDRTHLRFFTRRTATELLQGPNLKVVRVQPLWGRNTGFLNRITFSVLSNFWASQFLVVSVTTDSERGTR